MSGHQHTHTDHTHSHTHGGPAHADDAHPDWAAFGELLELSADVHTSAVEQTAEWLRGLLRLDGGHVRRALDIGSGPGGAACVFARAFPDAEVVAVDGSPELLARARDRAARLGVADRVRTHLAELPEGLAEVGEAELIWSSKAVHHLGDQQGALDRLAAALRPGGVLAVAEGGLSLRALPRDIGIGRPGLLTRLDALQEEAFAEMRTGLPDAKETTEDWPAMLAAAGLTGARSRSFLIDLPAPLDAPARRLLHADLTRLSDHLADRLDATDRATLDRLLDPDDEAGVLRRPDVFWLSAQTVHAAVKPR
ncbi:class I SAM-dependent methyltransferase [Streptomyces sp. NPDC020845]|uniref:class I SAM-dependent methyltransferase n=1 Tax=Streptomyces sp. NPDC020845 TaxID=3365096 RepID=UPI00378CC7E1